MGAPRGDPEWSRLLLVVLRASRSTLEERAVSGRADPPFIRGYAARRRGSSHEDIHRGLIEEQAAMEATLAATRIPHRIVEADAPLASYVDAAYRFWLGRP